MSVRSILFTLGICFSIAVYPSYGQADLLSECYSENATNPIARAYILYKKRVWREIYLDEKQNRPCFIRGKEISKVIIDGVKKGVITPYKNDQLVEVMPMSEFLKNLLIAGEEDPSKATDHEFFPSEISTLSLVENVIFNKITSKKEYDIESIQLIIPGSKNPPTHLDHPIATFKYKDLLAYFSTLPFEAVCWYNMSNTAETLTWMDAFSLRLFGSKIVKIENLDDANLDELYQNINSDGEGVDLSQKIATKIDLEYEYFLSDY
ncbi:gliding motility protein GldN [Cardinium endosymbiont of Tipula unca]|uniref:type IX secretion system ring protein PorN/GldN n=1 Tax=Cardinium endosymbiont of Tipula unca TaxID=3066216 RepID=UPI0030CBAFA6